MHPSTRVLIECRDPDGRPASAPPFCPMQSAHWPTVLLTWSQYRSKRRAAQSDADFDCIVKCGPLPARLCSNYCTSRLFWVQLLYVFCLLQMTCMHLPGSRTQAVRHSDSSFSTRSLCSCKRVDIILWPNNSCASGLSVFKLDAAQCWHTRASCRVLDGTLDEVHGEKHTVASCAPSLRRNR